MLVGFPQQSVLQRGKGTKSNTGSFHVQVFVLVRGQHRGQKGAQPISTEKGFN